MGGLSLSDKRILYELDIDSRLPAALLAKKLKLPKETVRKKIKRLKEAGIVRSFYTLVNTSLMGYTSVWIFLTYKKMTIPGPDFEEWMCQQPGCVNFRILEGKHNISLLFIADGYASLNTFLGKYFERFGSFINEKDISIVMRLHKCNQRFLLPGDAQMVTIETNPTKTINLDATDLSLLRQMSADARVRLVSLSRTMHQDWTMLRYRIKRMQRLGVIAGYATSLDYKTLHHYTVQILILLRNAAAGKMIIEFFNQTNTSQYIYETVGTYDLIVEIAIQHNDELVSIMNKFNSQFEKDYISYDVNLVSRQDMYLWTPDGMASHSSGQPEKRRPNR